MSYLLVFKDRRVIVPDYARLKVEKEPGQLAAMEALNASPGMRILGETEYVEPEHPDLEVGRQIDIIEPGLENMPLYNLLRDTVFRRNAGGRESKILRYGLIRGFAPSVGITGNLEDRIFSENAPNDFTAEEYDRIAEAVHSELYHAVQSGQLNTTSLVKKETIRNTWLRGDTYFPDDWNTLGVLGKLCPELLPYHESYANFEKVRGAISASKDYYKSLALDTPSPNLFGCYLYFIAMRSVESRASSKPEGAGSGQREARRSAGSLFTFSDITEKLRAYFAEKVTKNHSLLVLLDVKKLPSEPPTGKKHKGPEQNFARGVYTRRELPEDCKLANVEPQKIYTDYVVLDYIFREWREKLVNAAARDVWKTDFPSVRTVIKDELGSGATIYSKGVADDIRATKSGFTSEIWNAYSELKSKVYDAINIGQADSLVGVGQGSFKRLVRKVEELSRFLPHQFGEIIYLLYKDNRNRGTRTEKREKQNRFKKLEDDLKGKHGIDTNFLFLAHIQYERTQEAIAKELPGEIDIVNKVRVAEIARQEVHNLLRQARDRNQEGVMAYSAIQERLKKMGLEDIITFINKELYNSFGLL